MSKNNSIVTRRHGDAVTQREKMNLRDKSPHHRVSASPCLLFILGLLILAGGCRYDMQDQPRYKYYKQSDFFANQMGSRPIVEGTVPRGFLREDKALFTGKKEGATSAPNTVSAEGGNQQPNNRQTGNTGGTAAQTVTYPDDVTEFPFPVTPELINRGEERYRVFCIVCHGPNGNGDGMVARRGYQGVKSYHTDQLRGAPVGHFYDVITNGWGRMNGYAAQVPVYDRWAIVAYIKTLQAAQDPNIISTVAPTQTQPAAQSTPATHNGGH